MRCTQNKFTILFIGLSLLGRVGLGHKKVTHVQLSSYQFLSVLISYQFLVLSALVSANSLLATLVGEIQQSVPYAYRCVPRLGLNLLEQK